MKYKHIWKCPAELAITLEKMSGLAAAPAALGQIPPSSTLPSKPPYQEIPEHDKVPALALVTRD